MVLSWFSHQNLNRLLQLEIKVNSATYNVFSFGAIYHHQLSQSKNTDINYRFGLEKYDYDIDTSIVDVSDNETGFVFGAGVRHRIDSKIELDGNIALYTDGPDGIAFDLGGKYHFTPQFALQASMQIGGDYDTLRLGGRYTIK